MCIDFEVKVCTGTGIPQGSTKKKLWKRGFFTFMQVGVGEKIRIGKMQD